MKFKFDAIVAVGFVMGLVLLHNIILYGGDIARESGILAIGGEVAATIALFGLGLWAMIVRSPAPKIIPAHHEATKHAEKNIEG